MVRDYRRPKSRLARRQKKSLMKQTFLFVVLTMVLILAILRWGLPILVKMAGLIADMRSGGEVEIADTIAPPPPRLQPLAAATNSAEVNLKGFAEAGASIKVSLNGFEREEVVAESDGTFLIDALELNDGENRIWAVAADPSGNESQRSEVIRVIFDNQAPELVVDAPEDGMKVTDSAGRNIEIRGITDEDVSLTINDRLIVIGRDGSFSSLYQLGEGENKLIIVARDAAGNQARQEITVEYAP
jgi:hypothetical protein